MRVDDALGRPGRSRREDHERVVIGGRTRCRGRGHGPAATRHLRQRGVGREDARGRACAPDEDAASREPQRPREAQTSGDADHVLRFGTAQGAPHAAHAEAGVGDDDHGADAPGRVDGGDKIGPGRDEHGHAVTGHHAEVPQPLGNLRRPSGKHRPAHAQSRSHVGDRDGGVRRPSHEPGIHRIDRGRRRRRRARRLRQVPDPVNDVGDARGRVLGDQVASLLVSVHVGVWHA